MTRRFLTTQQVVNLSSDPESGVEGEIYYNTVNNVLKYYNGVEWSDISTTSVSFESTLLLGGM